MQKKTNKQAFVKVDYRLLYKKRILDYLKSLKDKDLTLWEMDEAMGKLFNLGDETVIPICLAKLRENDEEMAPIVCYALEYANNISVLEPLLEILIMTDVSDRIKARIIGVLGRYGVDAADLPLEFILKDFDKVASDSMLEMFEDVQKDPFLIPHILDDLNEFSPEMRTAYIRDMGDLRDERSIYLLEIIAFADDYLLAQEAVKALGKIKSGKSLYLLFKLASRSKDDKIRKSAFHEAQRLRLSGVIMSYFEPWQNLKRPIKAFVSSIDGTGNRSIWMVWQDPFKYKRLSFVNLLINTELGVVDCWGVSDLTAREFNSSINDFSKTAFMEKCDFDYVVTLLGDALLVNQTKGSRIPYQFYFWKYLVELNDSIKYEKYCPKFEAYDLETLKNDDACLKKTFGLIDYGYFDDWFIRDPRVCAYVKESKAKHGYQIRKLSYQKSEKLFRNFTEELIEPNINIIKRMLELSADFLERSNCQDIAKLTLCALLNMDMKPLCRHPFIQGLIIESLRMALGSVMSESEIRSNLNRLK